MKFHIELIRKSANGAEIIHRATVDEINPNQAKVKSEALLGFYASRGARVARVLNTKNEELYRLQAS